MGPLIPTKAPKSFMRKEEGAFPKEEFYSPVSSHVPSPRTGAASGADHSAAASMEEGADIGKQSLHEAFAGCYSAIASAKASDARETVAETEAEKAETYLEALGKDRLIEKTLLLDNTSIDSTTIFKHKFKDMHVPGMGGAQERTHFFCTAYFPKQFHALRMQFCGGDYEYIQSLSRSTERMDVYIFECMNVCMLKFA
jgi:glucose-6-phosphate isomerase